MDQEKHGICLNKPKGGIFFILDGLQVLSKYCILFICFFCCALNIELSAKPLLLDSIKGGSFAIKECVSIYIDSNGTKHPKDFEGNQLSDQFKPLHGELTNRDYPKGVYWIRFTLEQSSPEQQWLIELPDLHIDKVEFYTYDAGTVKLLGKQGHYLPFSYRHYHHKNLVFVLPAKHQARYLLRLESRMISSFEILLKSPEKFTSHALREYYMLGIYYGILLIMILYNLLLYVKLKETNYLLYVFYVMSCALYTFREDGIGFQYLWPQNPTLNSWLNQYFELFLLLSFSFYSISFLELKKKMKVVYCFLLINIIIYVFLLGLIPFWKEASTLKLYIYLSSLVLLYVVSIYIYQKGNRYIRYYIIAYSFLLLSVLIFQARILGIIEHNSFTIYIFNFGFIVEIVLMSFAMGEKMRISMIEKEEAQHSAIEALKEKEQTQATLVEELKEKEELKDRINRELEKKVQERTIELAGKNSELEEKNEKLALMSAKLEAMNSHLDKNNWELNKEVKQKTIATIAGDEISLEDFLKVFPTETACLLYLCELKWKDGYRCQKCGNTKYNNGDTPLSRKCSKCNHRESPKSGTLFHGVKTDLNKAFYITYLSVVNPKKYTLEELSNHLQISLNTCWKIRKKVSEKRKELEAKHLPANKWENYLL